MTDFTLGIDIGSYQTIVERPVGGELIEGFLVCCAKGGASIPAVV